MIIRKIVEGLMVGMILGFLAACASQSAETASVDPVCLDTLAEYPSAGEATAASAKTSIDVAKKPVAPKARRK